jgi:hypothetical protein
MKIKTNNVPRDLVTFHEVPLKYRPDFDYIDESEHCDVRFFQYRGTWYDVTEFVRIVERAKFNGGFAHPVDSDSPLMKWHGVQTDSFFSGVVVRYPVNERGDIADCDRVVVGLVLS